MAFNHAIWEYQMIKGQFSVQTKRSIQSTAIPYGNYFVILQSPHVLISADAQGLVQDDLWEVRIMDLNNKQYRFSSWDTYAFCDEERFWKLMDAVRSHKDEICDFTIEDPWKLEF